MKNPVELNLATKGISTVVRKVVFNAPRFDYTGIDQIKLAVPNAKP